MERNMMSNSKTRRITFRIEDRLYDFLRDFSKESKIEISALCRNVITSYFMSYLLGELQPAGLKERFMKKYNKKKKKGIDKNRMRARRRLLSPSCTERCLS
jgi:hypothetical protein